MKILPIIALTLFMLGCANAQSTITTTKLKISGEPLPAIRHITDMKVSGDTLMFVCEREDGHGQRFLRRALISLTDNIINVSSDIGRLEDGYYASYMPYPFISDNGAISVIGQDDCEIYSIINDTSLIRTGQYLLDGNSTLPFPISQYVQDIFMTGPDKFIFIVREPKGGRQFAMTADLTSDKIDTIRQICISPELQAWMPNAGELAYSAKYNRLAFAYKLHPIIELSGTDGKTIRSVKIGEETFNPKTLQEADIDELNSLHTVDITYTPNYIYALYWGFKYADNMKSKPTIIKLDWDGKIISRYPDSNGPIYRISAVNDSTLIGWNGKNFIFINL